MKKVLIIAAEYPPSASVGAKRPAKLAARIAEHGWLPYVLTMTERCYQLIDEKSVTDALRQVQTFRRPCRSIWLHSQGWQRVRRGLPRLRAMGLRMLAKYTLWLVPIDQYYPWSVFLARYGARLVRREGIDLIWATVPPLTAADLAKRIWRRTGVPYVVDLRDVQTRGFPKDEHHRQKHRRLLQDERQVLEHAAGITYAAPADAEFLREAHPGMPALPGHLATNWFEQEAVDACPPHEFDRATILLGGTLHSGSAERLSGLFEAMKLMVRRGVPNGRPLQFIHLSQVGIHSALKKVTRQLGVEHMVQVRDRLPEAEFRSYCRGSDVLLLQVRRRHGEVGIVPAKLYEYFAARRPILVIGPPGGEAGRMVVAARRGLAVADNDPHAIADALEVLLNPEAVRERFDLSAEAVRAYEATAVVKGLADFLTRVSS